MVLHGDVLWQVLVYLKVFDLHGKKALLHYVVSAIMLALLSCGLGTFASMPQRWWLE